MARTTIYSFAKRIFDDEEANCGGIILDERKYLKAIGLGWYDRNGEWHENNDADKFYTAIVALWELHKKYDLTE